MDSHQPTTSPTSPRKKSIFKRLMGPFKSRKSTAEARDEIRPMEFRSEAFSAPSGAMDLSTRSAPSRSRDRRKRNTPRHRGTNAVMMSVTAEGNAAAVEQRRGSVERRESILSQEGIYQDYSESMGMDASANDYVSATGSHSYTPWKPIWL